MSLQKPIEAAKKPEEPINRLKDHKVEGVVLHILPKKCWFMSPQPKSKHSQYIGHKAPQKLEVTTVLETSSFSVAGHSNDQESPANHGGWTAGIGCTGKDLGQKVPRQKPCQSQS